jgi:DNA-binding NarL/FixJ family response regulator
MAGRIQVLIVDDHPLFRNGLRQVILDAPQFKLAGEVADGETALKFILEKNPTSPCST